MRVGMVCPYSLDVPGGVQNHVHDLARSLLDRGHEVSVLAPGSNEPRAPYVVSAGRAVAIPYNGSVGRIAFGPVALAQTRRWMRDGGFDVLHVHEPTTPSVSLIALGLSTCAAVATFHMAIERSRAMAVSEPILRPAMEKLSARIAVSEHAQRRVEQYVRGDSVVIPNGLYVDEFARTRASAADAVEPLLLFLGRFEEPRKGLHVLVKAFTEVLQTRPGTRLVIAGAGDPTEMRALLGPSLADRMEFVGLVDNDTRAQLLADTDLYIAPNTGGESFGIVLIEAMAAGAPVVASDIPAFATVLEYGRWGALFESENHDSLAKTILTVLDDSERHQRAAQARAHVRRYDWSTVTQSITRVYDAVLGGSS